MTYPKKIMKTRELLDLGMPKSVLERMRLIKGVAHQVSAGKTSDYFYDTEALEKQLEKESRLRRQLRGLEQ